MFDDPQALDQPDAAHPDRFNIMGYSARPRLLFVVYAVRSSESIRTHIGAPCHST